MSYRWGFDLDMAAVRLMRREAGHWREIGVEKIDSQDIEERLKALADQIDEGAPVDVFLPRDQILYTDLTVSSEAAAKGEIEQAVVEMTPYALEDLAIDWEMSGPTTARVAAIARETLDEAFAFAESRGRVVSGYSSLADPEDFPRMPDFGGMGFVTDEDFGEPVPFTSSRPPTTPRPAIDEDAGKSGPVVQVDDTTPVMQIETQETPPPLDPGAPINPEMAAPRVSTDIAASTVSDEVGATLSPKAVKTVRAPRSAGMSTMMIFAVAFVLTVGIAFLVWSILPLSPGRNASAPVNGALETGAPEAEAVTAPVQNQEPEIAASEPESEPETAPAQPDLPTPVFLAVAPALPAVGNPAAQPVSPSTSAAVSLSRNSPNLMSAAAMEDALPGVARAAPLPPRPSALVGLVTSAPQQGPDPREILEESTDRIYIASVEHSALAFDAIALPNAGAFSSEPMPQLGEAPAPFEEFDPLAQAIERAVIASIEPDAPVEDEPALSEPQPPVAADDAETITEDIAETPTDSPSGLRPTALAAALPETAPRARPNGFVEAIERDQFGGRTRDELSTIRPSRRPESEKMAALREAAANPPSALAVAIAPPPRLRPRDFDAVVAQTRIQREAARVTESIALNAPDTTSAVQAALEPEPETSARDTPRLAIPSNASVARQATIENAIRLNRINLVGVYGSPSDRRALVRLSSGRYLKLKVGDRIDGGTVARITDNELLYNKGRRTLSLSLPKG